MRTSKLRMRLTICSHFSATNDSNQHPKLARYLSRLLSHIIRDNAELCATHNGLPSMVSNLGKLAKDVDADVRSTRQPTSQTAALIQARLFFSYESLSNTVTLVQQSNACSGVQVCLHVGMKPTHANNTYKGACKRHGIGNNQYAELMQDGTNNKVCNQVVQVHI